MENVSWQLELPLAPRLFLAPVLLVFFFLCTSRPQLSVALALPEEDPAEIHLILSRVPPGNMCVTPEDCFVSTH